jgi:hypothetical protein
MVSTYGWCVWPLVVGYHYCERQSYHYVVVGCIPNVNGILYYTDVAYLPSFQYQSGILITTTGVLTLSALFGVLSDSRYEQACRSIASTRGWSAVPNSALQGCATVANRTSRTSATLKRHGCPILPHLAARPVRCSRADYCQVYCQGQLAGGGNHCQISDSVDSLP